MPDDEPIRVQVVEHTALDALLEPHQVGNLYALPDETDIWVFEGQLRTGLADESQQRFGEWALMAIKQLYETGDPAANGWFPSQIAPGCWYMTAALHELPSLD